MILRTANTRGWLQWLTYNSIYNRKRGPKFIPSYDELTADAQ